MPLFWRRKNGLDAVINRPVHRPLATVLLSLLQNPALAIATCLYRWRTVSPPRSRANAVSVVCISDTHSSEFDLPDGDILVHAGDLTHSGTFEELQSAVAWISSQPHAVKIVVAGNHDVLLDASLDYRRRQPPELLQKQRQALDWGDIIYLQNTDTVVTCPNGRRLRVYGSPLSPKNGNWAFQYSRDENPWQDSVPCDADILITHTPPRAHRDLGFGCAHLLRELWRVQPLLHVVGHVHEAAGMEYLSFNSLQVAYERTGLGSGSLWDIWTSLFAFIQSWTRFESTEAKTTLVNAAMVGGWRDDKRREAITIAI